jgi:sulfotransferase famil protein
VPWSSLQSVTTVVNDRIAFLHVPKTGGTWVTEALRAAGVELRPVPLPAVKRGHGGLEAVDRRLFTFAFVRDPFDWYASYWRHRQKFGDWDSASPIDEFARLPFTDFVEQAAMHRPRHLTLVYERYCGPPHDPISFVGRYERLAEDLVTALTLAGEPFDDDALHAHPAVNTTDRDDSRTAYSAEARAALIASERDAFARFYPELLDAQPEERARVAQARRA